MNQIAVERPGTIRLAVLPPLALYVHIPWCVRKCPYCDFNSHERGGALPEREYVERLFLDLEGLLPSVWGRRLVSVFIGGGTPSLFSPESIDALLSGVRARLPLEPQAEISLEANPGTVEAARFRGLRQREPRPDVRASRPDRSHGARGYRAGARLRRAACFGLPADDRAEHGVLEQAATPARARPVRRHASND